jgi:hypothetical protein
MESHSGGGAAPFLIISVPADASPEEALAALQLGADEPATLIAQLRSFADDAVVLARLCMRLSQVALMLSNASAADAVAAVVTAMRAHHSHAALQHAGCTALTNLPFDSALKQRSRGGVQPVAAAAAVAGAIQVILRAMHIHTADPRVQQSASYALGNLSCNYAENAQKAVSLRAFDAVVAAMRSWPADAEVQAGGCVAVAAVLGSCVTFESCIGSSMQVKAVDAGALDVCVAALKAHPCAKVCRLQGSHKRGDEQHTQHSQGRGRWCAASPHSCVARQRSRCRLGGGCTLLLRYPERAGRATIIAAHDGNPPPSCGGGRHRRASHNAARPPCGAGGAVTWLLDDCEHL